MANFNSSANMNLPIPVVGVDPGPDYALNIDNCLALLDAHDHSVGKGVQITPSGLNINSDLSFLQNNAIALRSSRYSPQSVALSLPADLGCVYVAGLDLYYNDVSGNQIRITQGGSVAGSTGTITGLPSGTASASYAAGTFVFQSATNVGANIDGRNFILRNNVVSSKGLTLSPPNAMSSDYTITLPALPAVKGIVTLNSSGTMAVEPSPPPVKGIITMNASGNLAVEPAAPSATSFIRVDPSGNLSSVAMYDIVVGINGDYATINAAIAAATAGMSILILRGTYVENVIVDKALNISGNGRGTIISGSLTFAAGSSDSLMQNFKVTNGIIVNSGVQELQVLSFWLSAGTDITDSGVPFSNFFQGMKE